MSSTPLSQDGAAGGGARPRKPRFDVVVLRVCPLTPRMVRVTFGGESLADFGWNGPAAHIKLFFGTADAARPITRTYTPRRYDRATRELDVDFVLHDEGPASAWAQQASPGQTLVIAGPGRSYSIDEQAEWFLLAADDTAIPAVGTLLEALPAHASVRVLLEVVDAAEEGALSVRPGVDVEWLHRGSDVRSAGRALEAAVRRVQLPAGSGRVYVACESDAMRRIRRHLLQERLLSRDAIVTRGYWRLGETDHPDRDYGEDVG
jgi:NADPH-dependent ferric siderophore reductase